MDEIISNWSIPIEEVQFSILNHLLFGQWKQWRDLDSFLWRCCDSHRPSIVTESTRCFSWQISELGERGNWLSSFTHSLLLWRCKGHSRSRRGATRTLVQRVHCADNKYQRSSSSSNIFHFCHMFSATIVKLLQLNNHTIVWRAYDVLKIGAVFKWSCSSVLNTIFLHENLAESSAITPHGLPLTWHVYSVSTQTQHVDTTLMKTNMPAANTNKNRNRWD